MKKLSFSEFVDAMYKFNDENNVTHQFAGEQKIGFVVFTKDSFNKPYSLKSRTYAVSSGNKFFIRGMGGNSIFGDCLDGSENGVRLDWYIKGEHAWKIDYCYFKD